MKGTILITDTLFIFKEHEDKLRAAGYEIERLDKPEATEAELIKRIKGKVGYVLGGVEHITKPVIDSADMLKVISFTGIGYKGFIPAWEYATERGITITHAPDGPTHSVAEWAIGATLLMNRGFLELGKFGDKTFKTTTGIEGQHVGIIGLGRIGTRIAEMLSVFRPASVSYWSKHLHHDVANTLNLTFKELPTLLKESDIVFLCVSDDARGFMDTEMLSLLKDSALLVSFMHPGIIDEQALLSELKRGRVRVVSDYPAKIAGFQDLPATTWYSFKASNAFNTAACLKHTSDITINSILNVLESGKDQYRVN